MQRLVSFLLKTFESVKLHVDARSLILKFVLSIGLPCRDGKAKITIYDLLSTIKYVKRLTLVQVKTDTFPE